MAKIKATKLEALLKDKLNELQDQDEKIYTLEIRDDETYRPLAWMTVGDGLNVYDSTESGEPLFYLLRNSDAKAELLPDGRLKLHEEGLTFHLAVTVIPTNLKYLELL